METMKVNLRPLESFNDDTSSIEALELVSYESVASILRQCEKKERIIVLLRFLRMQ